jgi:hypothetical protein
MQTLHHKLLEILSDVLLTQLTLLVIFIEGIALLEGHFRRASRLSSDTPG